MYVSILADDSMVILRSVQAVDDLRVIFLQVTPLEERLLGFGDHQHEGQYDHKILRE